MSSELELIIKNFPKGCRNRKASSILKCIKVWFSPFFEAPNRGHVLRPATAGFSAVERLLSQRAILRLARSGKCVMTSELFDPTMSCATRHDQKDSRHFQGNYSD